MLTAISWLFNLWPLDGSDGLATPRVCREQADFLPPLLELMVSLSNGSPLSSHGLRSLSIPSPLLSYIVWQIDNISVLALLLHLNSSFQAGCYGKDNMLLLSPVLCTICITHCTHIYVQCIYSKIISTVLFISVLRDQ